MTIQSAVSNQVLTTSGTPAFVSVAPGNLLLSGNTIVSSNTNGNINLVPNGTGALFLFNTTGPPGNAQGSLNLVETAGQVPSFIAASYFSGAGSAPTYWMYKSRSGTIGSFSAVQAGDTLGRILGFGDDGAAFQQSCSIVYTAGGAVSAGIVPGLITISTANSSGSLVAGMTLNAAQVLTLTNPLRVGSGGLGITTIPTNGQVPIGNGTNYVAGTLTAGTGISISNGSGSITINSTASGLGWTTLAGTSQAAAVDRGYVSGAAGATTITLPATAAVGSVVAVEGLGAGGWILAANTGQTIKIGTSTTSSAGSLASAASSDNIYVTCIVADTTWRVRTTNSAGLTIT